RRQRERLAVRLFVGNLAYSTTEADLRSYFGTVAAPSQVVLPVDRETGRPRGFGPRPGGPGGPGGPRPGGFGAPRPGGFGGPRFDSGPAAPPANRAKNFGPD